MDQKAVVLHSGGQDSTTCLAWALHEFGKPNVYPVMFLYGQRHAVELTQALKIQRALRTREGKAFSLSVLSDLGGAALTDQDVRVDADARDTGNTYAEEHGLPSTFVPGRNLLFFTTALAYGVQKGAYHLVTGVCEEDRAGYPDCREEFVGAAQLALREALGDNRVTIDAPLLHRSKAQTFELAEELYCLDLILEETHTCYEGNREHRFNWGYGCGECPACRERARGWAEFQSMQLNPID